MRPLRVAMIAQRFWPRAGALETRAGQVACELADRGADLTVVTARWHAEWPAEIHFHGLPVVRLAPPPTGRWRAWLWRRALFRWLRRNADQFDVALVWGMMGEAQAAIEAFGPRGARVPPAKPAADPLRGCPAAAPQPVPVVLVPERTGWQGDCFRQVRTFGGGRAARDCRRAAAFVAASPAARRELEAAGYSRQRIRDVPPGVPLLPPRTQATRNAARELLADANPALRLDAASPLVISTTRLAADRGWQCLLTAWSIVARRRPSARLWLAGEAPQAAAVVARIRQLDLAASVDVVGVFDDVEQLLPAAEVHVSPAPEGGPQAVLEAMAAGLPSVAADVPDNRWLLGGPAAGVLFPPDDSAALAAAIEGLLDDAAGARRLGTSGWMRAQRDFTLGAMADGFFKLLEDAANAPLGLFAATGPLSKIITE